MPMTFLSGTFYLVSRLPEPFRTASHFNPFFYLIDGLRYGFIGHSEGSLAIGVALTAGLTLALLAVCLWMFQTGYKMKT
jgi:ABC-2 type transport system permease protein